MSLTPSIPTLAETPLTPYILCIISHSTSHHASLHTRLHIVSSTVHQQMAPSHHCSSASAMPHIYSTYTLHHFTSHHITSPYTPRMFTSHVLAMPVKKSLSKQLRVPRFENLQVLLGPPKVCIFLKSLVDDVKAPLFLECSLQVQNPCLSLTA